MLYWLYSIKNNNQKLHHRRQMQVMVQWVIGCKYQSFVILADSYLLSGKILYKRGGVWKAEEERFCTQVSKLFIHIFIPSPQLPFQCVFFSITLGYSVCHCNSMVGMSFFLAAFLIPLSISVSPCHHLLRLVGLLYVCLYICLSVLFVCLLNRSLSVTLHVHIFSFQHPMPSEGDSFKEMKA